MTQQAPFAVPTVQVLLDAIPASAVVVDGAGRIGMVNRRWLQFCVDQGGRPESVSPSSNYLAACDPHSADGIRAVLRDELERFELEYPCHSPDVERWFRMIVTAMGSGAVILHVDITGEYARLSRWLETTSSPVIELNPRGDAVFVNDAWARLRGMPRRELLGARWTAGLGAEERQRLVGAVRGAAADGADRTVDVTLASDERGPLWIRFLVNPYFDGFHRLRRISLVGMNVTAARRVNDELAASAERERIAAHIHDGILQDLLAVGMTLQANRSLHEAAPELLADVTASLDRSIADLRALGATPLGRQGWVDESAVAFGV